MIEVEELLNQNLKQNNLLSFGFECACVTIGSHEREVVLSTPALTSQELTTSISP